MRSPRSGPRGAAARPLRCRCALPETVTRVAPQPGGFYVEAAALGHLQLRAHAAATGWRRSGRRSRPRYDAPRELAYRVRIGPLPTVAAADAMLARVIRAGVTTRASSSSRRKPCHAQPPPAAHRRHPRRGAGACRVAAEADRRQGGRAAPGGRGRRRRAADQPGADTPLGPVDTAARWAFILDFNTGATLLDKDADVPMMPLVDDQADDDLHRLRHAEAGRLKLDQELPVSERAWRMGGSKMFVQVGTPGEGRGPDPRHDRAVGQRRLHRARRGDRGLGGAVRRADEPEGAANSA